MNLEQLGFVAGSGWLSLKISTTVIDIFGRTAYDLQVTKLRRLERQKTKSRRTPQITIIVNPANIQDAEDSIKTLLSEHPVAVKIMIIENEYTGDPKKTLKNLQKAFPKYRLQMVSGNKAKQLLASQNSGNFIYLEANERLAIETLSRVRLLGATPSAPRSYMPYIRIVPDRTLVGLVQEYETLRLAQLNSLGLGILDSRIKLGRAGRNHPNTRTKYLNNLVIDKLPERSYASVLRNAVHTQAKLINATSTRRGFLQTIGLIHGATSIFEPFALGYFVYLAVQFDRPEPLALAWALGVFSLIFYAWADTSMSFWQKLRLILLSPAGFIEMLVLALTRFAGLLLYIGQWIRRDWQSWQLSPSIA